MMRPLRSQDLTSEAGMARQIRILLIDGQPLFLEALAGALRRGWPNATVLFAGDFASSMAILDSAGADVVLANVETLGQAEADFGEIVGAAKDAPVIATSHRIDGEVISQALAAGARGFLPKTMTGDAICGAITLALGGGVCLPTQALPDLSRRERSPARAPRSKRELEILMHLERGGSNKAIARELGISVATVKLHVQSILRVTGAKNRTEAIVNARRMGIVPAK